MSDASDSLQYALAVGAGSAIGFLLGLIGGGGSILAVPLLVYAVGVNEPHLAIGTSALAVAVNAAFSLIGHSRNGSVNWRCAGVFAYAGWVDWGLAAMIVAGGIGGGFAGARLSARLAARTGTLHTAMAALLFIVAGYMLTI